MRVRWSSGRAVDGDVERIAYLTHSLVAEATKHIVEEGPKKGPLLDVIIMCEALRAVLFERRAA